MEAPKSVSSTDASATTLQEVVVVVKAVEDGKGDEFRKMVVVVKVVDDGEGDDFRKSWVKRERSGRGSGY